MIQEQSGGRILLASGGRHRCHDRPRAPPQGSPKKWTQPHNPRNFVVTSNGVRTLLVVAGTPTTLSRTSTLAPGSGPSSVAGSMPPSPTKAPAGAVGMPHSLSMPGLQLPLPHSGSVMSAPSSTHFGQGMVPHALSLNAHPAALLQRGASQQPARNSSGLHQALLQRVSAASSASQPHRLAQGSAQGSAGGSSSGSTPRDPTNRV